MEVDGVKSLLIDGAILFADAFGSEGGGVQLVPDAKPFLLRLQHSGLLIAVFLLDGDADAASQRKQALQAELGVLDGIDIVFVQRGQSLINAFRLFESVRGIASTSSVFVISQRNGNDLIEEDRIKQNRTIVVLLSGDGSSKGSSESEVPVRQLRDVPMALAALNKKVLGTRIVNVGHCMKWSRELDFLRRGAFPMAPTEHGLSFVNIELDRQLEQQLSVLDIILHKATDEALTLASGTSALAHSVQFSRSILDLQKHLQGNSRICVIDPFDRILPLLDRVATQKILLSSNLALRQVVRCPRFLEVNSFEEPDLSKAMESADLVLPVIVKSRVACGVSDAHTMAVVFRKEGFNGLMVPLPATIQEYIDHGAIQFKFYVLGNNVLFSRRKSTPDAATLAFANDDAPAVVFDSLKSLPTSGEDCPGGQLSRDLDPVGLEAMEAVAKRLRETLELTIIGFDVVIQAKTNDYVIVDVNYFPSFKDVPNAEAIAAFWDALLTAFRQWSP